MDFTQYTFASKQINDFKKAMGLPLTMQEFKAILKMAGLQTYNVEWKDKKYIAYSKYDIDCLKRSDRFFYSLWSKLKEEERNNKISAEYAKLEEPNDEPYLSNMENASDELLKQDEIYY